MKLIYIYIYIYINICMYVCVCVYENYKINLYIMKTINYKLLSYNENYKVL